jgi:ATP-dependent DNA helicase DinG
MATAGQPPRAIVPIDPGAARAQLAPGGAVGAALAAYEHRPQQLAMLGAVAQALNDDEILVVEAGTGTGKSFAYLIPAILWSRANGERVIVSTHTITLQEQLVHKDLPLLAARAGLDCRAVLVKGRGNYVCRRKAAQAAAQPADLIEDEYVQELRGVLAWAATTSDGSLADLPSRPRPEVWEQVACEHDNCLRAACAFYPTCFFYAARRAAAAADILVVNHHLLLADVAVRTAADNYDEAAVLPPSSRVIIDEAHHLEDVATAYFGSEISAAAVERTCARLQSRRHVGKGVLPALAAACAKVGGSADAVLAAGAARRIDERLIPGCAGLVVDAEEAFSRVLDALLAAPERGLVSGAARDAADEKIRVTAEVRTSAVWRTAVERFTTLAAAFDGYADAVEPVLERIAALPDDVDPQVRFLATELGALANRLRAIAGGLMAFTNDAPDVCRWFEIRLRGRTGPVLSVRHAPVDVAPLLHRGVFDRLRTAVLTSATLAVGQGFTFMEARTGIDRIEPAERVRAVQIPSPFDFSQQALLLVPTDVPEPTALAYEPATHALMREILAITGGGTFLLFTAYGALNRAWFELAGALRARGCVPLRQGELGRHALLTRFTQSSRAVLFATDSFWEGVDVPGAALRCVVIPRLPFRVPTEPIEQARVEAIAARGGDPFAEHAVPQAAIKLKQGFGRLIRTRADRGCVVVLDSRLARKRYGRTFLASLPPARRVIAPRRVVLAEMARFYGRGDRETGEPCGA